MTIVVLLLDVVAVDQPLQHVSLLSAALHMFVPHLTQSLTGRSKYLLHQLECGVVEPPLRKPCPIIRS